MHKGHELKRGVRTGVRAKNDVRVDPTICVEVKRRGASV
jgi:hypothetical protein